MIKNLEGVEGNREIDKFSIFSFQFSTKKKKRYHNSSASILY